jgi:hypothetical protein
MDYQTASDKLSRGRNGRRKIGNNTYLYPVDNGIAVRLHATDVVVIHPDNTYTLKAGGWQTATTKARINEFSPARVSSHNGIWYVKNIPFKDGMQVDENGNPINAKDDSHYVRKMKNRLDTMVRNYINGFAEDAVENGLRQPSGGDCWGCHFTAEGNDDPMGVDHLLSHFEENYYVPSLLWKAINARGYGSPPTVWHLIQADVQRGNTRMLKDVLRSYFRKQKPALLDAMMACA